MSFRPATFLAVAAALGATILGLLALGASSVGFAGLRVVGFGAFGVGGLVAAFVRWRREKHDVDGEALVELARAHAELDAANPAAAAYAASRAVALAGTTRTRNRALTTLAWAALGQGYPERAKAALDDIQPSYELDMYCLAAVECSRGKPDVAIQALEIARAFRTLTCDGAKMLVDCHVRVHGIERALLVAQQNRKILGAANCAHVVAAARLAGAHDAAARFATLLLVETPALPAIGAHAR
jgi:hypothetical protein